MRSGECVGDLRAERQDETERQPPVCESVGERLSFQKLHHEVVDLSFATDVEERADVRV